MSWHLVLHNSDLSSTNLVWKRMSPRFTLITPTVFLHLGGTCGTYILFRAHVTPLHKNCSQFYTPQPLVSSSLLSSFGLHCILYSTSLIVQLQI